MKTKRFDNVKYNIGLDIGTNSVGWAVTGEDGHLLKYKSKNMWGSRLFEASQSAKDTRVKRNARRRYARRKQRIVWLQELLADEMQNVDSKFFERLKDSFLWQEDRKEKNRYTLFNSSDLTEKEYYENYPTIYHLRKELCESKDKFDFRLVYLAIHHIIKYRGNFLYEGQKITGDIDINEALDTVLKGLDITADLDSGEKKSLNQKISGILKNTNKHNKDKQKEITECLENCLDRDNENIELQKKVVKELPKAILGYKTNFGILFNLDLGEGKLEFPISKEEADDEIEGFIDDEQSMVYDAIKKIYSAHVLKDILGDKKTISSAMVKKYDDFANDFKELKNLLRKHTSNKGRTVLGEDGLYEQYMHNEIDLVTFAKEIDKELKTNSSLKIKGAAAGKNDNYLSRINSKDNGAIPYQLHKYELEKIVDNQSKYYPSLAENKDKLISILEFRIPYYIGPLSTDRGPLNLNGEPRFHWVERKAGKIYPWNFNDIIDREKTAEKFITRMLGNCSYLTCEPALPRYSLLFSEFAVRNEIKQISVAGKKLSLDNQNALFEELFCTTKKITEKALRRWCLEKGVLTSHNQDAEISGFSKENEFANSMQSYIDMKAIFGELIYSNYSKAETIIKYITLFEDKKILERKLRKEFHDLNEEQIKCLLTKRYTGWGNLSQQLLNGITSKDHEKTIIELMRESKENFMQIIHNDKYGFQNKINEYNKKGLPSNKLNYKQVDELVASPAVKKGIWQSISIVKELIDIIGHVPENIYLEFAREEGEKKRTVQRYKQLSELYERIKKDEDFKKVFQELKVFEENKKALEKRSLFLYFTQNGKCLYTGKPLDINMLDTYQVDHILPQAYIKDDSFTNLALVVSKENQRKNDSLLLKDDIISRQKGFWKKLLDSNLITKSKYSRLTRTKIDEEDLGGFINRQLVETRQIILNVANLLKYNYPETEIHSIKASLTHNLRSKFDLHKVREINDYHHAHDAFLTSFIGIYLDKRFPGKDKPYIAKQFGEFLKKKEAHSSKYGYFIDSISCDIVDSTTGELLWDSKKEILYVRKALNFNDCFITKKHEDQLGSFYDETIQRKAPGYINLKNKWKCGGINILSTEKYGGYTGEVKAYYVLVEFKNGNDKNVVFTGIPTRIAKLSESKPNAISDYFNSLNKGIFIRILKDKIKKYQKIQYENNDWYLINDSEVCNAKQLILNAQTVSDIAFLSLNPDVLDASKTENVFDIIIEKMKTYPCYKRVQEKIKASFNKFKKLNQPDQFNVIKQLLNITHANSLNGALKKLLGLSDGMGRLHNKTLKAEEIIFIDDSITGLKSIKYVYDSFGNKIIIK